MIDLFAGSGGMGLGMELAGFHPVFVNELNRDALATYLVNRPHLPVAETENQSQDILEFTQNPRKLAALAVRLRSDFGDIDLVTGGPPCQGYSGIGHRRTFTDLSKEDIPSNHLYKEMATFISAVGPKAFVFENVRGLLSSKWTRDGQNGEVWQQVYRTLQGVTSRINGREVGYFVRYALVRAKDYGVPQNRPRVLVVGIRNDLGFLPTGDGLAEGLLPVGTERAPDLVDVLGDLVDPRWAHGLRSTDLYPSDPANELQRWYRIPQGGIRALGKGQPVTEHEYSQHSSRVIERFAWLHKYGKGGLPAELKTKKFNLRVLPARWGTNGAFITVASLADDYVHYEHPRTLTVREWARLQTFPDWYEFKGQRTTGGRRRAGDPEQGIWTREVPKYTQIGNAVPVLLARELGRHLSGILSEIEGTRAGPEIVTIADLMADPREEEMAIA